MQGHCCPEHHHYPAVMGWMLLNLLERRLSRLGRWPLPRLFWRREQQEQRVVVQPLLVVPLRALQERRAGVSRLRAPVLALPFPQRLGRQVVRRVPVHPLAADKRPVLPRPRRKLLMVRDLQSRQRIVEVVVLLADLRVLRGVNSNPCRVRTQNRVQRVPSRMRVPRRVIAARVLDPAQMAAVTKAPKVFLPLAV